MSRFNSKNVSSDIPQNIKKSLRNDIVLNAEDAISFKRNIKEEIVSIVSNAILSGKDNFYETDNERMYRIAKQIIKLNEDPELIEFLAKATVFSRKVANFRSLPVFLTVLLATYFQNNPIIRKTVRTMVSRPDDMIEIVSLWDKLNPKNNKLSKNVPSSIRRGLKDVIESEKFNEFGYKRYFNSSNKVKMSDIIKIARPKPKNESESKMYKNIIENKLSKINTLETLRPDGMTSKDAMIKLLNEKKLGYMAAIKNVNNFLIENPTDEELNMFLSYLMNENAIKNSKVFPFRIWDAWKIINENKTIDNFRIKKIRKAFDFILFTSLKENYFFEENEKVAIVLDESGSMSCSSVNSNLFEIANIIAAMILTKSNLDNTLFYSFSSQCRKRNIEFSSIIKFIEENTKDFNQGGTYVNKVFELLLTSKTFVNKVIILTDEQIYDPKSSRYQDTFKIEILEKFYKQYQSINPNVQIIFWNLNSYKGGTPISLKNEYIYEINGYSANIINYLPNIMKNKNFIINEIEKIELI